MESGRSWAAWFGNARPGLTKMTATAPVWWVDLKAYPHVIWAHLRINDHGEITVLTVQGAMHEFDALDEAISYLRAQAYRPAAEIASAELALMGIDTLTPPPETGYFTDLLPLMRQAAGLE